ncbi:LysM domain receptor-like kinase 3 [Tanacetum coccineum]
MIRHMLSCIGNEARDILEACFSIHDPPGDITEQNLTTKRFGAPVPSSVIVEHIFAMTSLQRSYLNMESTHRLLIPHIILDKWVVEVSNRGLQEFCERNVGKKNRLPLRKESQVDDNIWCTLSNYCTIIMCGDHNVRDEEKIPKTGHGKAKGITGFDTERPLVYDLDEIAEATNNFDDTRIIGEGGYGSVYFGILGEKEVAIKKMRSNKSKEFLAELKVLNEQSDFWSGQQDWKIVTWRLYESLRSPAYCENLRLDCLYISWFERRYPLSKDLLQRMLDLGLEVERESSVLLI